MKMMESFGSDPTAGEKIHAEPVARRAREDKFEARPDPIKIDFLLISTPSLKGVRPDGAEIIEGRFGEGQIHASPRTIDLNSSFDPTVTVCPASSWAKPMAASLASH